MVFQEKKCAQYGINSVNPFELVHPLGKIHSYLNGSLGGDPVSTCTSGGSGAAPGSEGRHCLLTSWDFEIPSELDG